MNENNKLPAIGDSTSCLTVKDPDSHPSGAEVKRNSWVKNHSGEYPPSPAVFLRPISGREDRIDLTEEGRHGDAAGGMFQEESDEAVLRRRVTHCLVFGVMLLLGVIVIFLTKGLQASLVSNSMMKRMNGIGANAGAGSSGIPGFSSG